MEDNRLTASYKNIKSFMLEKQVTTTLELATTFRGDFTRRVRQMREEGYEVKCIRLKNTEKGEFLYAVMNPQKT
jgi:hypothetical protein